MRISNLIGTLAFGVVLGSAPSLARAEEPSNWAKANSAHCFRQHLEEAVSMNQTRRRGYSDMSQGRSDSISEDLIALDRLGLTVAPFFDFRSRNFNQRSGVAINCEVIPSMFTAKPMRGRGASSPVALYKDISPTDILFHARALHFKYGDGSGLEYLKRYLASEVHPLESAPQYNCLARHFLKSMVRLLDVAADHPELAADPGYPWALIETSLVQLEAMDVLDHRAAPLQAEGIPILCQELPVIPTF